MRGKCSALVVEGLCEGVDVAGLYRRFAGVMVMLSTGLSTPVQNVQNPGRQRPHRPSFLLKMGKVISVGVV
jgi:hypothetical protein